MAETVGSLMDKIAIGTVRLRLGTQAPVQSVVIREQRSDLSDELNILLSDLFRGHRTMRVYRQFKEIDNA